MKRLQKLNRSKAKKVEVAQKVQDQDLIVNQALALLPLQKLLLKRQRKLVNKRQFQNSSQETHQNLPQKNLAKVNRDAQKVEVLVVQPQDLIMKLHKQIEVNHVQIETHR